MSRSFKKYGIIKDKGMSRGEYNRRFRRVNRQRINEGKDPKHLYEVINSWCVFVILKSDGIGLKTQNIFNVYGLNQKKNMKEKKGDSLINRMSIKSTTIDNSREHCA